MTTSTAVTRGIRGIRHIVDLHEVDALADELLSPARSRPLVVLTSAFAHHGAGSPNGGAAEASVPLDAERIAREVGDVADVCCIPTGELTRRLDGLMPDRLQVYGGAGRSYPVRLCDDPDWRRSPLRFPGDDPAEATRRLISDAVGHAHAAGLFARAPLRAREASGSVQGITAEGSRALVRLDDGTIATVRGELTFAPVPLDWALARGQPVAGVLDEDTRRLALDTEPPPARELVSRLADAFPHGSVTLALVTTVTADCATLDLHPHLGLEVRITDVSPNPLDRIDLLFTEGEVVRVRVVHLSSGALQPRLSDVDDDEPVVPPLPLLPGGEPWLREDRPLIARAASHEGSDAAEPSATAPEALTPESPAAESTAPETLTPESPAAESTAPETLTPESPAAESTAAESTAPEAPAPEATAPEALTPESSPAPARLRSRPLPGPGPRVVASAPRAMPVQSRETGSSDTTQQSPTRGAGASGSRSALKTTQLELQAARARIAELERRVGELGGADSMLARLQESAAYHEQRARDALAELGDANRRIATLKALQADSVRALRSSRRTEFISATSTPRGRRDAWPDDAAWVRHEIACAWVARVPASDKATFPLPEFAVGDAFAGSLLVLDASQFDKAMKAAIDVLTRRAEHIPGRDVHRLRTSDAGGSPYRVRDDGASAMRCAIEQNTPSARRLHYWVLPGGMVELARVGVHDDTDA